MDVVAERALALAGRRAGHAIPLSDLAAQLDREIPGLVRGEEQLALRLARHPFHLRIVRLAHTVWDVCTAWPAPIREHYLAALRTATGGRAAYVVALRPAAAADAEPRTAPHTLELLDATVAALTLYLDDAGPLAAAHWRRMTREAQNVRHALQQPMQRL